MKIYRGQITIILIIGLFFLSGCVGFFESTQSSVTANETESKQQKAESAVEAKILESFGSMGTYKGYVFGDLFTLKPKEIIELDQLFELKRKLPSLKEKYPNNLEEVIAANDSSILAKKKEIKEKKIYHTYEISHVFKIVTPDNINKLYECKFVLLPNYKIKDVQILLNTELDKKEDELFYYFIMQFPLYEFENTHLSSQMNKETYAKLNTALENETKNKAQLLRTVLSICKYIRINNDFNETHFATVQAMDWILKNENYSTAYKKITFSELMPIDNTVVNDKNESVNIPLGYKLYHKFESKSKNGELTQRTFQFEFDLNFVIIDVSEIISDEKE